MKCWECKREIASGETVRRVPYCDGSTEKFRDVCYNCLPLLELTSCGFAGVPKITQTQIKRGGIISLTNNRRGERRQI